MELSIYQSYQLAAKEVNGYIDSELLSRADGAKIFRVFSAMVIFGLSCAAKKSCEWNTDKQNCGDFDDVLPIAGTLIAFMLAFWCVSLREMEAIAQIEAHKKSEGQV